MGGYDCTETELERIMRDEKEYADAEYVICPVCDGSGSFITDGSVCTHCKGFGELTKAENTKRFID